MSKQNVYDIVSERILEVMSQGQIPWVKPWSGGSGLGQSRNLLSGHKYRGVNAMLTMGFDSPFFCTFKQAQQIGANVKAGAKGTPIVFWGKFSKTETDDDGEETTRGGMFCRYFTVFNSTQLENLSPKLIELIEKETKPVLSGPVLPKIEDAEKLIEKQKADIRFEQQRAFYSPQLDYINMPKRDSFANVAEFYSTMFHELGHWTGHKARLDRKELTDSAYFGSHSYSNEELTAELCAAFVCSSLNISTESSIRNSAAYLQSWMKRLKDDPKLFVMASQRAQKASDLILGIKHDAK